MVEIDTAELDMAKLDTVEHTWNQVPLLDTAERTWGW